MLRHLQKINSLVALKKEAICSTETLEQTYDPTQRNNPAAYQINVCYSFNNDVAFYITLAL